MRAELDQRFGERFFAWAPYLYAELGGPDVEREERWLIEAGTIRAIGYNYVTFPRGEGLATDSAGSWSPSGGLLAFQQAGRLAIIRAPGGTRPLSAAIAFASSPVKREG
jgi:hypothetical protein